MNAAETSASSAIADCTPLTVASRSRTTAEIETFISDVSTTSTNIAIDRRTASRVGPDAGSLMHPSLPGGGARVDGARLPRRRVPAPPWQAELVEQRLEGDQGAADRAEHDGVRQRPAVARSGEPRGHEGVPGDQHQAGPFREGEGGVDLDDIDRGEDEEDRREDRSERDGGRFAGQLPQLGAGDLTALARLGAHELAVDLGQADRHGRAHDGADGLGGGGRMLAQGDDQREPDDRPVYDPRDIPRA